MAGLIAPELDRYVLDLLPPRDPVIAEMEAYAAAHDVPIVGPAVATLLEILARSIGAQRIFELGSAIGYSTAFFARAVGKGGQVTYTDGNAENAERAKGYLERLGYLDRVAIRVGDAVTSLEATTGYYDVIFIDVDKDGYPQALQAAAPRVRRGGYLIADNVLWSGQGRRSEGAGRRDGRHPPVQPAPLRPAGVRDGDRSAPRRCRHRAAGGLVEAGSRMAGERDSLASRFRRYAASPELDLFEGALLVAELVDPGEDLGAAREAVAALAARVEEKIAAGAAPHAALGEVLFEEEGFRGDEEDYDQPSNSSVARALFRHRGLPITLSILAIEVGRLAGLRLTGVGLPGHFVVGGPDLPDGMYLDPFDGGELYEAGGLARRLAAIFGQPVAVGPEILQPDPPRAILARVLLNLRRSYEQRDRWEDALEVLSCAEALEPDDPEIVRERGLLLVKCGRPEEALPVLEAYAAAAGGEDAEGIARLIEAVRARLRGEAGDVDIDEDDETAEAPAPERRIFTLEEARELASASPGDHLRGRGPVLEAAGRSRGGAAGGRARLGARSSREWASRSRASGSSTSTRAAATTAGSTPRPGSTTSTRTRKASRAVCR